jgi:hypothetical protein
LPHCERGSPWSLPGEEFPAGFNASCFKSWSGVFTVCPSLITNYELRAPCGNYELRIMSYEKGMTETCDSHTE